MPIILITGTSTGIGRAAAELCAKNGWTVWAGSRTPENLSFTNKLITPVEIDVNDPESIARCFARKDAHELDCVVNNAGYGLLLPFEDTPPKEIEMMYRTNVFGLMEVSRHAARIFREKGAGTIINISSAIGRTGVPFYTAYASSKWAVEGFSESLSHELRPFNVHVKLIEPGGTRTEFHPHAYDTGRFTISKPYAARYGKKQESHTKGVSQYATAEEIAGLIYESATDGKWQLRYMAKEAAAGEERRRELGSEEAWRQNCERMGSVSDE